MNPLLRLESLLRGAFERPVWVLGGQRFHPAQLAAQLEDAMRGGRIGLAGGTYVPEHYALLVHPADLARFGELRSEVERGLTEHLESVMSVEGYRRRAPLAVTMREDAGVQPGRVEVDATFAEAPTGPALRLNADHDHAIPDYRDGTPPGATIAIDRKAVLAAIGRPADEEPSADTVAILAALDSGDRERERHSIESLPCIIGRAPDCDIVLSDLRVSRHHARIVEDGAGMVIEDLESANGVRVNGQPAAHAPLSEGDMVTLGGPRFRLHLPAGRKGQTR